MKININGNINEYYIQTLSMLFFPGVKFSESAEDSLQADVTITEAEDGVCSTVTLKNGDATLAIGSDFDGVDRLPEGITSLCDLPKLYHLIDATFGKALTKQIFSENAERYFAEIPR